MGRKTSKADLILEEARGRVEDAQNEVNDASKRFDISMAKLRAHQEAYVALERQLAREPRRPKSVQPVAKKSKPAATTETGKEIATTATKCAVPNCGLPASDYVHSLTTNLGAHIFHAKIKVKGSKKEELPPLPDNPEEFQHGVVKRKLRKSR